MELGWSVGDRDERYHDGIGVGFDSTGKYVSHDYVDFIADSTVSMSQIVAYILYMVHSIIHTR